jgi:hypothetical protein
MKALNKLILIVIVLIMVMGCKSKGVQEIIDFQTLSNNIDNQKSWEAFTAKRNNLKIENGKLSINGDSATITSKIIRFNKKQQLQSITIKQDPTWNTWEAIPKVTPKGAWDAPVFIPVSDKNYWFLSRFGGDNENGFHAWHSSDMQKWIHYGPVSSWTNQWVTSAEYVDGKFYIYFDKPNDEDPHLIIDSDLTDGIQGEVIGKVLDDPTHGSDMAIFRNDDGTFHIIYEDWSPINPRKNSWDSPLAGHADSPDGINGFLPHEYPPPIDERTTPTGKIKPYKPATNQLVHGPDQTPYEFEVHEGPQDAFGDYTMIKVGEQYYIFCDYDSHDEEKSMRVGRWRSNDIAKTFEWDGEIGEGFHPDPTVGFAEGKFYLLVQRNESDFISDGPWVDGVEIRVGVDTDNDGKTDEWTPYTKVKETYKQKEGFVRVIESQPAQLDLSGLSEGYAFKVEMKLNNKDDFSPVIDAVEVQLK